MGDSSRKLPFRDLKELAACLDRKIADASRLLEGPKRHYPYRGVKVFERTATIATHIQLIETRLRRVVDEESASNEDLKECARQTDRTNKETLPKLTQRGLEVPEDMLPAVEHLSLWNEPTKPEEASMISTTAESLFSCPSLKNEDAVFGRQAAGPSWLPKPVQGASRVPIEQPRLVQNSTQVSRIPTAVERPPLSREPAEDPSMEKSMDPSMASAIAAKLFPSHPKVMDLDVVFGRKAAGRSETHKPRQVALCAPKQPQRSQGSPQASRLPSGPIQSRTRLDRYLARIDHENTLDLMQSKPPLPPMKSAAKFPPASSTPMMGAMAAPPLEEPTQSMIFPASKQDIFQGFITDIQVPSEATGFAPRYGVAEDSVISDIQPFNETSEIKENILEKVPDKESRKPGPATPVLKELPGTPVGINVPHREFCKPRSKTPELEDLPDTPVRPKRKNLDDLLNSP